MGKIVYKDKWVSIKKQHFKVNGKSVEFTNLIQQSVSVVIPVFDDGKLLLEKQYRHMIGKYLYEFPAGHIDKGENPLTGAKRELKEETGYTAKSAKFMFKEFASPGTGARTFYYFHAKITGNPKEQELDQTEMINLIPMSLKQIDTLVKTNKIQDHKTIAGFLYYKNYVLKK